MGKGNSFREPRRRGFDDDNFSVRDERGGSRSNAFTAPTQPEGPPAEGVVKWFNPDKGFGFVTLSNGAGDAFLHASVLQAAGRQSALPGAKVRGHVGPGPKGPQVTHILEVDDSSATAEPKGGQRSARQSGNRAPLDPSTAVTINGTVMWFNADKGFGFVKADDGGKDIFVHISVLERTGLGELAEGQQVTARVVQTPKGREAISIAKTGEPGPHQGG